MSFPAYVTERLEEGKNEWTMAQEKRSWKAIYYSFVLAANTGMRGCEIKKLRIGSIDLQRRRIVVRRGTTKTNAGVRHIDLNDDATEAVEQLLVRANSLGAEGPEHFLLPKHLSRIQHTLGPKPGKRGYDPTQHQKDWGTAWNSLTKKAGMPGFRFHDLRHTFITHLVERGIPIGLIQAMVGHISARMVKHYTHIASGAARKAVARLDSEPILARRVPSPNRRPEEGSSSKLSSSLLN